MSALLQLKEIVDKKLGDASLTEMIHEYTVISTWARRSSQEFISDNLSMYQPMEYLESYYVGRGYEDFRLRSPLVATLGELRMTLGDIMPRNKDVCKLLRKLNVILNTGAVKKRSRAWVRFTHTIDWNAGEFGDGGSCLWGGKVNGRYMIQKNKAFAVQFFADKNAEIKMGRCWGWWSKHGLIIWNGYNRENIRSQVDDYGILGRNSDHLDIMAMMIAKAFGVQSKKIVLHNEGKGNGNLHINKSTGYLIAPGSTLKRIHSFDFNWPNIERVLRCGYCTTITVDENEFVTAEGRYLACRPCADNNFEMCSHDMRLYLHENVTTGPDGLRYAIGNLSSVKKFVYSTILNDYLLRSKARLVGTDDYGIEVWIKLEDTRTLCSRCRRALTADTTCAICKDIVRINEEIAAGNRRTIGTSSSSTFEWRTVDAPQRRSWSLDIGELSKATVKLKSPGTKNKFYSYPVDEFEEDLF